MEAISFIGLVLLSLVGYSAGAVSRAGKAAQLQPEIIDLVLIVVIWTGAIYSGVVLDLNRWLLILAWLIIGYLASVLAFLPRKIPEAAVASRQTTPQPPEVFLKRLWRSWSDFSRRMSNFQSRLVISLVFFTMFFLPALMIKAFSDPLKIKHHSRESYWLPRKEIGNDMTQFRRQS
jgi:hypothetical protein